MAEENGHKIDLEQKLLYYKSQPDTKQWIIALLERLIKIRKENEFDENANLGVEAKSDESYELAYERYADDFTDTIVNEPILDESSSRINLLPIEYTKINECYELQLSNMWFVTEVDFSEDQFDQLPVYIQIYLLFILAFFAGIDGIIANNLSKRFINDVKIIEAQRAYAFQTLMEYIHNETYNLNLEAYIEDVDIRHLLFDSIKHFPSIQKKGKWCYKWINSDKTFAHRVVAFIAVEGINFSGSFGFIFWLQSKGYLLPGLFFGNDLIRRDEASHVNFAIELYKHLKNKLKEEIIKQIFMEAVENEIAFISEALDFKAMGLDINSMSNYIRYVANDLLNDLDLRPMFDLDNSIVEKEFAFMQEGNLRIKANFFENRSAQYQNAHNKKKKKIFNKNADV